MKRAAIAVITVLAVLGLSAPALATQAPAAHRSCIGQPIQGTYFPDQNVWSTKWGSNAGHCQQRSHAVWVQRLTGNHKTTNGGWVYSTTITSATSGGDTSWAPACLEAQWRTGPGGTVHTLPLNC